MKTLLLTGHLGFLGSTLLRWLPDSAWAGQVRVVCPPDAFDLLDPAQVDAVVRETAPDWVLHLAALSHVPSAVADPVSTLEVNLVGTTRLLLALQAYAPQARLLFVSSGDVYGAVALEQLPIAETTPPAPLNPYAVSKAAAELMCLQAHRAQGLDVVVARPFNHTGPGQRTDFVVSAWAREIAEAERGLRPPELHVGNLDATRDFTHVLDLCEGYLTLLAQGRAGEVYNLCSGRELRLRDLLDAMLARANCPLRVVPDPARMRAADQPRVVGDPGKAFRDTGWQAQRPLEPLLDDVIDYWRRELAQ